MPYAYPDLATYLERNPHITQAALASAVGTSQGTISRIAKGDIMPRPALARRLAKFCQIPLDSFTRQYRGVLA